VKLPLFLARPRLGEVFGVHAEPVDYTYVDRGQLDERLQAAKQANKHVAIHGESKHGKSWLRARGLPEHEIARVQCTPWMTAEHVLESALGRLSVNRRVRLTATDSSETATRAGAHGGPGGLGADLSRETRHGESRQIEEAPIGQDPADLGWVAEQFRSRSRRPVFEDFHNLSADDQRTMAFVMKAFGDWGVPCVVIGIWTDNHLLTYYNGELDGRIEDLDVQWTGAELRLVVEKGSDALNIELSDNLMRRLLEDAYTSVGLMQQLASELLWEAGVHRRPARKRRIDDETIYDTARRKVVDQIASRFDPFIDQLPAAANDDLAHLLWAVTERLDDTTLLDGAGVDAVAAELTIVDSSMTVDRTTAVLERLHVVHRERNISPAVLAYDPARRCLILADRRFLLYRRQVSRPWPWND
jgi:hypothetical protein